MMNKTNLLLVLLSMVVWMQGFVVVDGQYAMGFDQTHDTDAQQCTPGKLKQVYSDIFDKAVSDGGWNVGAVHWKFRANVESELNKLQGVCTDSNINIAEGNSIGSALGLDRLSNDISTDDIVCPTDGTGSILAAQHHPNERRLCPDYCRYLWWYQECIDMGCRRRNLREGRELDFNKEAAVDTMYTACLNATIPCIDCSTAEICEVDWDGNRVDCAKPSCHATGTCWSSRK